jgi:hypothetical protein
LQGRPEATSTVVVHWLRMGINVNDYVV